MDDKTIIVKYSEADAVVKKYSIAVKDFKAKSNTNFNNINNIVHAMNDGWKGELYDGFRKDMEEHLQRMFQCMNGLDDLSKKLDTISQKFTAAINILKKSNRK